MTVPLFSIPELGIFSVRKSFTHSTNIYHASDIVAEHQGTEHTDNKHTALTLENSRDLERK